ncbi:glycosyltransferase [Photobacterium damselae]
MEIKKLSAPLNEDEIKQHWKYKDKIYISCVCITFNQKEYIRDAIDGFLAQETEYCFEIIIHDDVSTDGTRDILLEYKNKYPSIIKLVLQDENQYKKGKKITPIAVKHTEGEYIALCEGDDFWVDKNKINNQIKIFENNKNVSLVHTPIFTLKDVEVNIIECNKNLSTKDLLKDNKVCTLSTMFRKKDFMSFIHEFSFVMNNWLMLDWPLWIYLSNYGEIHYINDITSVYRIFPESASHSMDNKKRSLFLTSTVEMRLNIIKKLNLSIKEEYIYNSFIRLAIINNIPVKKSILRKSSLMNKIYYILSKKSRLCSL